MAHSIIRYKQLRDRILRSQITGGSYSVAEGGGGGGGGEGGYNNLPPTHTIIT